MSIEIQKGFTGAEMRGVVCPECGSGGGSRYPCWCHSCHANGEKVLMLPSVNGFTFVSNWSEVYNREIKPVILGG